MSLVRRGVTLCYLNGFNPLDSAKELFDQTFKCCEKGTKNKKQAENIRIH
jgi:hypothetical protein